MGINLVNYEEKARKAVRGFWRSRLKAQHKHQTSGKTDQGERSAVTGGKNMDVFTGLMVDIVHENGLPEAEIHQQKRVLTLPGYFRPTKLWDLLVLSQGHLVAALEFKSHVGPLFGKNFNNRSEEAIGTAHDFSMAYREGAFGEQPSPFVGWMILVEDAPGSRKPVEDKTPHFQVFKEFQGASYAKRYEILCRKLIQEKLYTTASVILSPRSAGETGEFSEMSELTGLRTFVSELAGHVAAEGARSDGRSNGRS